MNVARYVCEMKYPVAQKYMTPLSDAQLTALYDYRAQDLVQCLEENGFVVDSQPPSEAVFLQSDGAWNPYGDLTGVSATELGDLNSWCPQAPEFIYDIR